MKLCVLAVAYAVTSLQPTGGVLGCKAQIAAAGKPGRSISQSILADERTYKALGELETGNRDFIIGSHGERSRYQIMPDVWRHNSKIDFSRAVNCSVSRSVAMRILKQRSDGIDESWMVPWVVAILWHCPGHFKKGMTKSDVDYATRFQNLWLSYNEPK